MQTITINYPKGDKKAKKLLKKLKKLLGKLPRGKVVLGIEDEYTLLSKEEYRVLKKSITKIDVIAKKKNK